MGDELWIIHIAGPGEGESVYITDTGGLEEFEIDPDSLRDPVSLRSLASDVKESLTEWLCLAGQEIAGVVYVTVDGGSAISLPLGRTLVRRD